jgi:DNA-binding NarL/FixJ family response regulator
MAPATSSCAGAAVLRIRVLVVDPHPLIRWGLAHLGAGREGLTVVGDAAGADDALTLAATLAPDVVIHDDSLDRGGARPLAAQLRAAHSDLGIVVLSADGSDHSLFRALEAGASAFVAKTAPIDEVVSAIRAAAVAPNAFAAADLEAAVQRRQAATSSLALSAREQQILFLLHDGLSVPEIAAELYLSLSTTKTYVARAYEKLGARNRAQALMAAVHRGLFTGQVTPAQARAREVDGVLAVVG